MAVEAYFINKTRKQILSSKKLSGHFEDSFQLIAYLNICIGDEIITCFENELIEDILFSEKGNEYKNIKLYDYEIYDFENLYDCKEFDRLEIDVNSI